MPEPGYWNETNQGDDDKNIHSNTFYLTAIFPSTGLQSEDEFGYAHAIGNRVIHLAPHDTIPDIPPADRGGRSAGCSRGVVRADGVDRGPEAGNSNPKSLSSAVRTATTFKEKSAKDFRARDMMTSVFDFRFSALGLLSQLYPTLP